MTPNPMSGWYHSQREHLTKNGSEDEFLKVYNSVVFNLRKTYGINDVTEQFGAQVLIDEVATLSVRIRKMERLADESLKKGRKADKELEKTLDMLRGQRNKALLNIATLATGKNVKSSHSGRLSYRDKMNRSKKLQQVTKIHDTIEGSTSAEASETGETVQDGDFEEIGLGDQTGGDIRLPAEMDSGPE